MNNREQETVVLNEKRKQYQNKIMEFMINTQSSNLFKQGQSANKNTRYRQKPTTHNSIEQSHRYNQDQTSIKKQDQGKLPKQTQSKNNSTHRSKTLNRKTTSVNTPIAQQQIMEQTHKNLLQKIQSRIEQMNQKISQEISNQEQSLLNEYQQRLRSKQQQLNRLRRVTNPQMISQKTLERKEQLEREKQNLIEGNHYHSERLEELKKQFGRLTELRDNQRKNLQVLMVDQVAPQQTIAQNQTHLDSSLNDQSESILKDRYSQLKKPQIYPAQRSHFHKSQLSQKNKKKPLYFSTEDYVQKVLQKYNQKSQIISESRLEQSLSSQKDPQLESNKKHQSLLPRILQKKQLNKSKSINPEEEHYSYRKIRGNFDRAKSTSVFDSMGLSIESKPDFSYKVSKQTVSKLNKLFEYNNKNSLNSNSNQKGSNSIIKKEKSMTMDIIGKQNKNIAQQQKPKKVQIASKTNPAQHYPFNDKLQYTKQYLQQFVVKKTTKDQVPKTSPKQRNTNRMNELIEKEQLIKEQLQPQLKIQAMFRTAAEQYYKFKQKHKNHNQGTGESIYNHQTKLEQRENTLKDSQQYESINLVNKKKTLLMVEMKEFDKKLIMDLLLNHHQFKRYLYQLILSEFQPKINNPSQINLQKVVKNFDHSNIYSDRINL